MPERTTVVLPADLKLLAVLRAREQGISFGEFVRRAVKGYLTTAVQGRPKSKTSDPFLDNLKTFRDDGPTDWSTRVDELLYETLNDELRRQRSASGSLPRKRSVSPKGTAIVAATPPTRNHRKSRHQ